jgi:hypothetical protein
VHHQVVGRAAAKTREAARSAAASNGARGALFTGP